MTTFLLVIHVLSAMFGFGVVTAFPFLGVAAERDPASARALMYATEIIAKRAIYPAIGIQLITGGLLILSTGLNLTKNAWLGAAIVLFIALAGVATGVQVPLVHRIVESLRSTPGTINDEAKAMMVRARGIGMGLSLGILVIAVLMVWKPGLG